MSSNATVYIFIAQSVAVVISAVGIIATIYWNRVLVRRRATIDMLFAEQTDEYLLKKRSEYLEAVSRGDLASFAEPDKWLKPKMYFLNSILNRRELTAIGISEGIIDADLYRRYWGVRIVEDWIDCQDAAERRRAPRGTGLYEEFEQLAYNWATEEQRKAFKRTPKDWSLARRKFGGSPK